MANNKAEPAMTLEQKRYYAAVARLEPAVSVNEKFWQNGYRQGWLACSKDAIRAAQRRGNGQQ